MTCLWMLYLSLAICSYYFLKRHPYVQIMGIEERKKWNSIFNFCLITDVILALFFFYCTFGVIRVS